MKKLLNIIVALTVIVFFTSCDDWLELFPSTSIADVEAITTGDDARIVINGVYDAMRHYDFYGRAVYAGTDSGTDDVVLKIPNSNRYTSTYAWTIQPGDQFLNPIWVQGYKAMLGANQILRILPGVEAKTDAEESQKSQLLGEAYFCRALIHFEILNVFSQAYNHSTDASHLGIPYKFDPDPVTDIARNTVKEVYDNIIADLEEAVNVMTIDAPSNSYSAGKLAAKALLARVYLYRACTNLTADYANAAKYAEEVINSGAYTIATPEQYAISGTEATGFVSTVWGPRESSESIFTLPFSATERLYTNALSYIYLRAGYGDLIPSENLVALIGSDGDDVRNTIFYQPSEGPIGTCKFFGTVDSHDIAFIPVIRISEMYLIAAEGYAKSGDETKAKQLINVLTLNRNAEEIISSGNVLVDEILTERRKELCFEGFRLMDHKRLNKSIVRGEDSNNPNNASYGLVYPNYKFAAPISDTELSSNSLMVQNPGYEE